MGCFCPVRSMYHDIHAFDRVKARPHMPILFQLIQSHIHKVVQNNRKRNAAVLPI